MLKAVRKSGECSIYSMKKTKGTNLRSYVVSTPQTRTICNDPLVAGVNYTTLLRQACVSVLKLIEEESLFPMSESETIVFNILRGGMNFGLREALATAFGWNHHGSAFISAQRARDSRSTEDWHITESDYKKVYLPKTATAIFGDVVATGTSLEHALNELLDAVNDQGAQLKSILFFTFGGQRAREILEEIDAICRERFSAYTCTSLIYFEGCFDVAQIDSQLTIRISGTDLLRHNSILAPEFIESHYESASYPIERCTIYDAGSRAFWLPEYFGDVEGYWRETLSLAQKGTTYEQLLGERFPELDPSRFEGTDLKAVCEAQLEKLAAFDRIK